MDDDSLDIFDFDEENDSLDMPLIEEEETMMGQIGAPSFFGELDMGALFGDIVEDKSENYIWDFKINILKLPVFLAQKTVYLFLTQDKEFCKLYLEQQHEEIPKYISDNIDAELWVLPRAYPICNKKLLNKLFYKSQQASSEEKIVTTTISINEIRTISFGNEYEVNYLNSQLSMFDVVIDLEFGG